MKDLTLTNCKLMDQAFDFNWKDLIGGTLARFGNEMNIQLIESRYPDNGNCQEFIIEFQKYMKKADLVLVSSTSISDSWTHICKKLKIKIYN